MNAYFRNLCSYFAELSAPGPCMLRTIPAVIASPIPACFHMYFPVNPPPSPPPPYALQLCTPESADSSICACGTASYMYMYISVCIFGLLTPHPPPSPIQHSLVTCIYSTCINPITPPPLILLSYPRYKALSKCLPYN